MSKRQTPQDSIPATNPATVAPVGARTIIVDVPLDLVLDNPYQTRQSYDEAAIADLAADIRARGLLQPPVARPVSVALNTVPVGLDQVVNMDLYAGPSWKPSAVLARVQLAFGHTRARACRAAGMDTMPVSLRVLSDEEMAEMAWSENERRSDVGPIDAAMALEKMARDFGWSQAQMAERLGVDRSTVSNKLRLLKLPTEVLGFVRGGEISERTAVALLPLWDTYPPEIKKHLDWSSNHWGNSVGAIVALARQGSSSDTIRERVKQWQEYGERAREREAEAQEKAGKMSEEHAAIIARAVEAGYLKEGEKLRRYDYNKAREIGKAGRVSPKKAHPECPGCQSPTIGLDYYGQIQTYCLNVEAHDLAEKAKAAREQARKERIADAAEARLQARIEEKPAGVWRVLLASTILAKRCRNRAAFAVLGVSSKGMDSLVSLVGSYDPWPKRLAAAVAVIPSDLRADQVLDVLTRIQVAVAREPMVSSYAPSDSPSLVDVLRMMGDEVTVKEIAAQVDAGGDGQTAPASLAAPSDALPDGWTVAAEIEEVAA